MPSFRWGQSVRVRVSVRRTARGAAATLVACLLVGEITGISTLYATYCAVGGYSTSGSRGGNSPTTSLVKSSWDYAPSIMLEGGTYRMWWCGDGGAVRDYIMYSTATNLNGPWSTPVAVFAPTLVPGTFDRGQTCDPSVIKVGSTYFMYYGGIDDWDPNQVTRMGVASSPDGVNWSRMNGGNAILEPARGPGHMAWAGLSNKYGVGQPGVTYVDGYFYIIFTDTTGLAADAISRGVFVMRSPDPAFLTGVEELTGAGVFEPRTVANHTSYALITDTVAADVQYVDATDQFAVAYNPGSGIYVRFFDGAFRAEEGTLTVAGAIIVEQPGIVGTPGKRALPSPSCGIVPLEFMRAVGLPHPNWSTWDLAYVGTDWVTSLPCDCTSAPTLNARGYNDMGDFTGDGYGDLGNHHRDTGNFWIRANWGGSFAPDGTNWGSGTTAAPPANGWETLVGDFNGDNLADYADRFTPTGQVWVHLNQGGSFGGNWSIGSTAAGANIEVLVGDLDGDNVADFLEHDRKTGQLWARKNYGAVTNPFRPPTTTLVAFRTQAGSAGQNYRLVLADFNNDGRADLAQVNVTNSQFSIYLNTHLSTGTYQFNGTAWTSGTAFNFTNFTTIFGDFNGDGWADYADVNRGNGEFWVHENMKNGAFNAGNWGHGYYSIGSGGFWIMGLPVSF